MMPAVERGGTIVRMTPDRAGRVPIKMTIRLPGLKKAKTETLLNFHVPYDSIKLRFRPAVSPPTLPDIRASLLVEPSDGG